MAEGDWRKIKTLSVPSSVDHVGRPCKSTVDNSPPAEQSRRYVREDETATDARAGRQPPRHRGVPRGAPVTQILADTCSSQRGTAVCRHSRHWRRACSRSSRRPRLTLPLGVCTGPVYLPAGKRRPPWPVDRGVAADRLGPAHCILREARASSWVHGDRLVVADISHQRREEAGRAAIHGVDLLHVGWGD